MNLTCVAVGFGSFGRFVSQRVMLRSNVKKVSIHLKSANVVITPSEGGRCNIVCCGIFKYPFSSLDVGVQSNCCSSRSYIRCKKGLPC